MGEELEKLSTHLDNIRDLLYSDLRQLIEQPSVSARNEGIRECAELVKNMLEREGFDVKVYDADRPVIVASITSSDDRPTILMYNHYDVQPPEPLEEWNSDPFKLVERDGFLFGRGVADNKGDIAARLAAVRLLRHTYGELPVSLKWIIEGEEEVGSPNLGAFIKEHKDELKADACLWEAGDISDEGVPNLYLGVKGLLYVEISARTSSGDRHSMYAPVIPNPAWQLVQALNTLRGSDGRVKIKEFYRDVRRPSKKEAKLIRSIRLDANKLRQSLSVNRLTEKNRVKLVEKLIMSPTCNIAGLVSGYTGPGAKTIVPSTASVKIDFRLVPDQRPEKILTLLKRHLRRFGDFEVRVYAMESPARSNPDAAIVKAAEETAREVYGVSPNTWPSVPGTGPMSHLIQLGIPSAMLNCISHPGSNFHAPNENIAAKDLERSVIHLAMLMKRFAEKIGR